MRRRNHRLQRPSRANRIHRCPAPAPRPNNDTSTNNSNASNKCKRSKHSRCATTLNTRSTHTPRTKCSLRNSNATLRTKQPQHPFSKCNTCSTCKVWRSNALCNRRLCSPNAQPLQRVAREQVVVHKSSLDKQSLLRSKSGSSHFNSLDGRYSPRAPGTRMRTRRPSISVCSVLEGLNKQVLVGPDLTRPSPPPCHYPTPCPFSQRFLCSSTLIQGGLHACSVARRCLRGSS